MHPGSRSDFINVPEEEINLLEAPVLHEPALDKALQKKINELEKAISHLKLLHYHDALVLLKNTISYATPTIYIKDIKLPRPSAAAYI